jgi:hypothetical protein
MKLKMILAIAAALAISGAEAQNALPTKKVTVFKNGTAMFVKEGNVPVRSGNALLPIPAQTLFGTYWLGAGKDNSIKNITFKNDTIKKQVKAHDIWQILSANVGKAVTVSYSPTQGIDKTLSGTIVSFDKEVMAVKIKSDAGKTTTLYTASIYQVEFKDAENVQFTDDSIQRMIVIKPEKPAENLSVQEWYMQSGINWLPSYFLKLKDDKNARIEMKATIENYAEELKDADMELVVGSPQMSFSNKMDPMTYDYLTGASYDNDYSRGQNQKLYMQSNAAYAEAAAPMDAYFGASFTTDGEKNDDQYLYKIGKVSMPKNSKASYPIFAGNVEYKDKYEGTIYDNTDFFNNRYVPEDDKPFEVFHSLEIKNNSNVPFTTAAIMVVNEKDQFVAQDELKYTPAGSEATIKLSKAIDIVGKNTEEETARTDNAKKIGKVTYSKVTLKGTITINNYQNKEVTLTLNKNINGTVLTSSDGGKITKTKDYSYINPNSNVKWDVKLEANGKKTITYEYEVLYIP